MKKPISVIDRTGKSVVREDGILLDGDKHQVAFSMMDAATAAGPVQPATLALGAIKLGERYNAADYAGLTEGAARQAIVRAYVGDAANGQRPEFFDSAWRVMAGGATSAPAAPAGPAALVLTDEQKATARAGIEAAVKHAGKKGITDGSAGRSVSGSVWLSDKQQQELAGHRAAHKALLSDAWKSPETKALEKLFDGASYEERMAITSGANQTHVKAASRKLSAADFMDRQRRYNEGRH